MGSLPDTHRCLSINSSTSMWAQLSVLQLPTWIRVNHDNSRTPTCRDSQERQGESQPPLVMSLLTDSEHAASPTWGGQIKTNAVLASTLKVCAEKHGAAMLLENIIINRRDDFVLL